MITGRGPGAPSVTPDMVFTLRPDARSEPGDPAFDLGAIRRSEAIINLLGARRLLRPRAIHDPAIVLLSVLASDVDSHESGVPATLARFRAARVAAAVGRTTRPAPSPDRSIHRPASPAYALAPATHRRRTRPPPRRSCAAAPSRRTCGCACRRASSPIRTRASGRARSTASSARRSRRATRSLRRARSPRRRGSASSASTPTSARSCTRPSATASSPRCSSRSRASCAGEPRSSASRCCSAARRWFFCTTRSRLRSCSMSFGGSPSPAAVGGKRSWSRRASAGRERSRRPSNTVL